MAATLSTPKIVSLKQIPFALLAAMAIWVIWRRDLQLLDANSPLRHHYLGIGPIMIVHGVFGALALLIAPFQFSSRIRKRNIKVHRFMGRLYLVGVAVAAPIAIPAAIYLGPPELVMASVVQATAWILTTGVAYYCIRTGRVQQHREWMMRSYPFAVVFLAARTFLVVPSIAKMGLVAVDSVVWSAIMIAGFLPSFLIALNNALKAKPVRAAS